MPPDSAISTLIDQLAAPATEADAAGSALLARGPAAVSALVDRLPTAPAAVRRRLAYLLGRCDVEGDGDDRLEALVNAIDDDDWKVRRNAAVSLGTLRAASATGALLSRVLRKTTTASGRRFSWPSVAPPRPSISTSYARSHSRRRATGRRPPR